MNSPLSRPRRATLAFATLGAVAIAGLVPAGAAVADAAETADQWPVVVTEIMANNSGTDYFEYFEVANLTDQPVVLGEDYTFAYTYGDTDQRGDDVALTLAASVTVPAGGVAVVWARNTGDTAYTDKTLADFRDFYGIGTDVIVAEATGQNGLSNSGGRGIRVLDATDEIVGWSHYGAADIGNHLVAEFGVPQEVGVKSMPVWASATTPTPGVVDSAALVSALTEPLEVNPAGEEWPVVVTEIMANNAGTDYFEYFEVANLTSEDVILGEGGYTFAYTGLDSTDRSSETALTLAAPVTMPAGGVAVVWARNTMDSAYTVKTVADFREFYGIGDDVIVAEVTGQNGLANGGERAIRVLDADDALVAYSFYGASDTGSGLVAEFQLPDTRGVKKMPVRASQATPTPGFVASAALVSDLERGVDESLTTSLLQITEVLPDSTNVGTADGYEFIEVYNPTDTAVDWADLNVEYLYPTVDLADGTETVWTSKQRDVVIEPGATLVLWIKNGQNDDLTDADFNTQFGTSLTMGEDLVEIFAGGMANGSLRGLEIATSTGVTINRAYYNVDGADDTSANQGIQYAVAGDGEDRIQVLTGIEAASPGAVSGTQVHPAYAVAPAAGDAPVITDMTATTFTPGEPLTIEASVTDDVLVRSVLIDVESNVDDEVTTFELQPSSDGLFRVEVPAADTTGKRTYTYTIVASDGYTRTDGGASTLTSTASADPLRMGRAAGEFLRGIAPVSAAADTYPPTLELSVDGAPVTGELELERPPIFAFEITGTDAYFQNGVVMDGEVLTVFDEGVYSNIETVTTPIALDKVNPGESFSVRVYAGDKMAPQVNLDENNDNFNLRNVRLVLPDGRTLRPAEITDHASWIYMGDSGGAVDYVEATFTVPDDAFTALSHDWDTTQVADGAHVLSAVDGEAVASVEVQVDNTAPAIAASIESGAVMHGDFALDADVTDGGSGVEKVHATLDGFHITLPYDMSSLSGEAGDHVAVIEAADAAGNVATVEIPFSVADEVPSITDVAPADGTTVTGEATLSATVSDPTGDALDVVFAIGEEIELGAGLTVASGAATAANDTARAEATEVTSAQVEALGALDGDAMAVESDAKLPYLLLEAEVPAGTPETADLHLRWDGRANAGGKVMLYVLDPATSAWDEVDARIAADEAEELTLEALVSVGDYAVDGIVTAVVQHTEGYAGDDLSTRGTEVVKNHPEDTDRSEYDFTFAVESDTQYYNQQEAIYDRQVSIHDFLLAEREDLNLQYLHHNGDIVNNADQEYQWLNADPQYAHLDEAGLPYGVLAGNHDVLQASNDYTYYSQWFGAWRYENNPWWGGDYEDNRGHYDLITAGGIDFLMLYMGWGAGDDEIDWMNEVLAQYPDRIAYLNLHEYLQITGGLGAIPQRIFDEVIAKNPNVRFVQSGHYHDAETRLDSFDDDGDGIDDRTVTSMLFDYQGLANGGEGYLRLFHYDLEGERIIVRTYSEYLRDYDAEGERLPLSDQEFEIPFAQAGIAVTAKSLVTDAVRADVLDGETIASFEDVASGTTVTTPWAPAAGTHEWYVKATDPYGATAVSDVQELIVEDEAPVGSLFTDIAESMFIPEISWLAERGITRGWDNGDGTARYQPYASITRDAMAAFLYRYAGSPEVELPESSPFADVTPTSTAFYKEIVWMHQQGISTGWDNADGTAEYRPFDTITRGAMAAFLYRYAGSPEVELPETAPFADVTASRSEFFTEIVWLESTGITTGWTVDGRSEYRPLGDTLRDAMAAFLYRFDQLED